MGKMIDAQSIVVASVATGGASRQPDAGTVLRSVFWHSVALAVLVGLHLHRRPGAPPPTYLWPWMVPGAK
jgi:lactate permease